MSLRPMIYEMTPSMQHIILFGRKGQIGGLSQPCAGDSTAPILNRQYFAVASVCLTLLLLLGWFSPALAEGPVALNFDIPGGKVKTIRLRNLPQGAVVAVMVECSAAVMVALIDSAAFQQGQLDSSRALFLGQVDRRLSFSVTIPKKSHYLLVFDNRSGDQARAVRVMIRATRPKGGVEL